MDVNLEALKVLFERTAKAKTGLRIDVMFSENISSACTDGNVIRINPGNSQIFGNVPEENRELFIAGLFGHELMHCLKTPFDELKEMSESRYKAEFGKFRMIQNVLEDPAIENFAAWFEGGFLDEGIKYVNECLFEESPETESIDEGNEDKTAFMQWKSAMLYYGWVRKLKNSFTSPKAEKVFYDYFDLYNNIINEADNHTRLEMEMEFYEKVKVIFPDIPEEKPSKMGYGPCVNMSGGQSDAQLSEAATQFSQSMNNGSGNGSGNDSNDKRNGSDNGSDNDKADKKRKDAIKNLNSQVNDVEKRLKDEKKKLKKTYNNACICNDVLTYVYDDNKKNNSPYIKQLSSSWKRLLTPEMKGRTFASGGTFNLDRYACKGHQTVNFFEKKKLPEEKFDVSVCILLDISGSMSNTMHSAMSQVQVLTESLTQIGADSCVITFNYSVSVIKKWHTPLRTWLTCDDAYGATDTTAAVLTAMETLKYRNCKNKLTLIVTDGYPIDEETCREAIKELSKISDVYTLLINSYGNNPEIMEYFRNIFGTGFCFSADASQINKVLTPKIRKSLRKWA